MELHEFPKLGKGGVIMETFRHCDADVVGFVDADCATPPAEFLRLAHMPEQVDGAIASRAHPASVLPGHRPLSRRIASWIFARLTKRIFGLPFSDTQCGAKVVRRQVIEGVLPLLSSRDFLFDVDLLLTAERLGFRIIEVPTVWLDQEGSHVRAGTDGRRMAVSSFRLWLHHRALPVASPTITQFGPRHEGRRRGPRLAVSLRDHTGVHAERRRRLHRTTGYGTLRRRHAGACARSHSGG